VGTAQRLRQHRNIAVETVSEISVSRGPIWYVSGLKPSRKYNVLMESRQLGTGGPRHWNYLKTRSSGKN
jgi:hypothetical protein